jgi:malate permease and related proteins
MNNYILLGTCFLLGILLRRSGRLPDNAAAALNGFVVHISLPALTLTYVHGLKLDSSLILPASMAWVMSGSDADSFGWPRERLVFHEPQPGG